jgi:hypothetical protein
MTLSDGAGTDPDAFSYFRLNCEGAGSAVPPEGSATFQMRFEVPAGLKLGEWTFRWSLDSRYGHTLLADHSTMLLVV